MGDLACDLQSHGHSVTVLTTFPHYNRDPEAESKQPLKNYWGPLLRKSNYHGVSVYHTMMPKKGSNVFLRLIAWAGFHKLSTFAGVTIIPKPDIILAPSPPLTIGLSAWLIGRIYDAPYIYNVQEIYPDIAIRLGALRNRRIIRFLFGLERFVYKKAAKVTVIARRMRQNLLEKGVTEDKLEVIPNFVDIEDLSQLPKDNEFSRMYAVQNKFAVSYAGNLGVPQGLNIFLEAADLLRHESGIRFMMMGDGMQREALRRGIKKLSLENFILLPHQPYSLVPLIYASSDANLVPQAAETGFDAVPSKVYRIMACSRPVIAVTDPSSDLARLVNDAGCGVVVPPGSGLQLAETILWAYRNQEKWLKMGEAGRLHVVQHYARKAITDRYEELALAVVSSRKAQILHDR
jgi:colanic acid biosynthesis glycosyl transferase WcaI